MQRFLIKFIALNNDAAEELIFSRGLLEQYLPVDQPDVRSAEIFFSPFGHPRSSSGYMAVDGNAVPSPSCILVCQVIELGSNTSE